MTSRYGVHSDGTLVIFYAFKTGGVTEISKERYDRLKEVPKWLRSSYPEMENTDE